MHATSHRPLPAAFHAEGVEWVNCGQAEPVHGRYPVHFHMAARVPAGSYVRSCAVHGSHFRAYTLHGTQVGGQMGGWAGRWRRMGLRARPQN